MSLERLEILGGHPEFETPVPLYGPVALDVESALREMAPVLESGILTKGPAVAAFEATLAQRTGAAYAVATSSGFSALVLLLQALRLEGEVVVPAYVFPPVLQAVLAAGLTPRLADIDIESWNLDPVAAEAAVGPRTCCVLALHTSGLPAPVAALESIAARKRVRIIFDAAHALGAAAGGRAAGSFGMAEVFSFTPSKIAGAGEGGAVTTSDARLAAEIAAGRNYGRSKSGDWTGRGLSARMPEVVAVLAKAALERLDHERARRATLASVYRQALDGVPGIRFQTPLRDTTPAYRDVSLRVSAAEFGIDRDALRAVLEREGVMTGAYFHPVAHDLPFARHFTNNVVASGRAPCPIARQVAAEVVNLPVGSSTTPAVASRIAELIGAVHASVERVAARFKTVSAPRPSIDHSY
jgi:dTDP-4-amino-4,6-dideoxygalactose transaminase